MRHDDQSTKLIAGTGGCGLRQGAAAYQPSLDKKVQ